MTQDNTGGDGATPAMTVADIQTMVDKYIFSSKLATEAYNKGYRQAELAAHTLGAAWMREQAASAAEDHGEPSCYQAMSKEFREGFEDAGQDIASAIRAIPLPTDDGFADLCCDALREAQKAQRKFPQPNKVLLKVAEEAGEVVKAAIHFSEGRETRENVRGEMVQTIAMLYRLWIEGDEVNGIPAIAGDANG